MNHKQLSNWICFACLVVVFFAFGLGYLLKDEVVDQIYDARVLEATVAPGQEAHVTVKLLRKYPAECRVMGVWNFVNSTGTWAKSGPVFVLDVSAEAVQLAEKLTPGQYNFSFDVPADATPGKGFLVGTALYTCPNLNPVTMIAPGRLPVTLPVQVVAL